MLRELCKNVIINGKVSRLNCLNQYHVYVHFLFEITQEQCLVNFKHLVCAFFSFCGVT